MGSANNFIVVVVVYLVLLLHRSHNASGCVLNEASNILSLRLIREIMALTPVMADTQAP